MPKRGQGSSSELVPVLTESGASSEHQECPSSTGQRPLGSRTNTCLLGSHMHGHQAAGSGAGPGPLYAFAHLGAQLPVSSDEGEHKARLLLLSCTTSSEGTLEAGKLGWWTTSPHGLRGEEWEGLWRAGWQPSYYIKTAVRKKRSGRREDAQQARGRGPQPMFWVRGGDGRAKLASKPCCLAATTGNVLSLLCISLCPAGPWTRGIPVGLPWNRHEGQPGSAGQPGRPGSSSPPLWVRPRVFTAWLKSA